MSTISFPGGKYCARQHSFLLILSKRHEAGEEIDITYWGIMKTRQNETLVPWNWPMTQTLLITHITVGSWLACDYSLYKSRSKLSRPSTRNSAEMQEKCGSRMSFQKMQTPRIVLLHWRIPTMNIKYLQIRSQTRQWTYIHRISNQNTKMLSSHTRVFF